MAKSKKTIKVGMIAQNSEVYNPPSRDLFPYTGTGIIRKVYFTVLLLAKNRIDVHNIISTVFAK